MEFYRTLNLDEYQQLKDVVKEHWGQKITYQGKEYVLRHIDKFNLEMNDKTPVYYAFCVLQFEQESPILASIKEVYNIITGDE